MKILFASAEVNPFLKVGGLGDVAGSLPKYLAKIGEDVRIVMPKYEAIKSEQYSLKLVSKDIPVEIGDDKELINIYQTLLPGTKVIVYLIENKKYISQGDIYGINDEFKLIQRFLFFSKAILEIPFVLNYFPDIFHVNDWHTASLCLFLRLDKRYKEKPKVLFTIHNLAMQGKWNWQEVMNFLRLNGDEVFSLKEKTPGQFGLDFNIIQQGILLADFINTVSPNYALEILSKPYFSRGLQEYFLKRKQDFCGILNGLDYDVFNPQTDPFIPYHYSVKNIKNKKKNVFFLKQKLGLSKDKKRPVFALVSRLSFQKGIDLILKVIDKIVLLGDIVVLGKGERKLENLLKKAEKKHSGKVKVFIEFNPKLAQEIYAGSNFFLIPSKFEPCGLSQMIAMRYGSCPIARAVGGLKDTIKPLRIRSLFLGLKTIQGTGIIFRGYTPNKFIKALNYGFNCFQNKHIWGKVVKKMMSQDFSWCKSAKEYQKLYKRIITR